MEADNAAGASAKRTASASKGASAKNASAKAASPQPESSGLDETAARAAGLSASDRTPKAAAPDSAQNSPDETANPEAVSAVTNDGSNGTAGASAGTPRAFVLAAAGFIGALGALALLFLAQTLGLVNAPSGQLDEQRSALLALEQQMDQRFASLDADQPEPVQVDLGPLEADVADLSEELIQLSASVADDAAPVDLDALLIDALAPLDERIGAIEAVIQSPALLEGAAENAGDAGLTIDPQELLQLGELIESAYGEIAVLRDDLGLLRSDFETLSTTDNPNTDQISTLDDRLTQMSSDMAGRLETLSVRVSELGDGMAVMGEELSAFEQAPVAVAPDQLARLGLALDGLAAARDSGGNLADALGAAQAASAFDTDLTRTLAPLSGLSVVDALDDAGLLARYDDAAGAMLAAAPGATSEGGGLLDALGERARQMVTIRAPGDAANATPDTVTGQIDQLGSLVASRQYEAASAAFDGLPDAVKSAGSDLQAALAARMNLDNALTQARSGLLAALASSNQ
ncbi:MAG: hypothetical protein Rhims3KO_11390 [Hyphomicrobiales bacterium]